MNAYRTSHQSSSNLSGKLSNGRQGSGALQHVQRNAPSRSHYRLLGLVGRGQYGKVFLGIHRSTGQLFALKELDHDRFPTNQFLRELRFLLTLQHPNIVTCWACEYWMQHRYLVTDYCEGGTLREWMDSTVSLGFSHSENQAKHLITALSIVEGILSGLAEAHEKNIIHCDIKPENILLEIRANSILPRIADFGIARVTQDLNKPSFTGTGMSGSPAYMAPERFFGQHSVSADLYAIGILMYELLMGNRPFSGTPGALRSAHLNNIVQLPDLLPDSIKIILLKALAKLPGQRYRDANEMRSAVLNAINDIRKRPNATIALEIAIDLDIPTLVLKRCSHESVQHPIQQLLIQPVPSGESGVILYRVESTKVRFGRFQAGTIEGCGKQLHRLSDSIEQAWTTESGCYIATSSHLYYCDEDWLKPCLDDPILNGTAIDPMGYWFTQVTQDSVQLFCPEQESPRWERSRQGGNLWKICAIDSRHFVLLLQDKDDNGSPTLHIEVWNRRGDLLGEMPLQVSIDRLWPTTRQQYLVATECHSPQSLLFIQLQPLQVRRVELPFEPRVVTLLSRGSVAIDRMGNGLVLNRGGEVVAKLRLPESPTAAVVVDDRYLLISTWAAGMGNLSVFDLEPLQEML